MKLTEVPGGIVQVFENGRTYQFTSVKLLVEWEQSRGAETPAREKPSHEKPGRENKSKGVSLRWWRENVIQQELGLPAEETRTLLRTLKETHPGEMKFLDDRDKLLQLALPLAASKFRDKVTAAGARLLEDYDQFIQKGCESPREKQG